jgi:hypothetical protein
MKAPVDEIFNSASTGAGDTYEIGKEGTPGQAAGIAHHVVVLQFIPASTFTIDVEYSLDGTNWDAYATGVTDATGSGLELTNAPKYLRINATALGGNLQVLAQKYIQD